MFFTFFFHFFQKKKVSSFLFSCISFKYFLLLALVSEFNCFLSSRCSMEMWCPHDIGRDSWDWVGPPAWGRACFNSPEWGGGSSPVKTEPHQIVLLLLLLWLLWLLLLCVGVVWCVVVVVVVCVGGVVCVVCVFVVCCVTLKIPVTPACVRAKTSPCEQATRAHGSTHVRVLPVHTETF